MKNSLFLAVIITLVWGCASKVQPTGGPKDEEPPLLIYSTPLAGQRNYKEQTISLEFNEYVKVKGLKEQLLITPRIDGDYEFKVKKRIVYLEFDQPFADSTTYTLNFREGISDITEGNPTKNLLLAFSTGSMLDTLEISGKVIDLLTKEPIDRATVGLYAIDDTLNIFTGPPYYLTQTNKQGKYVFKNLKDGTYKIYAFSDGNKNLICESDAENYGFLPQPVNLDTTVIADTINLFHSNIDSLRILRTRASGKYFVVTANKYLTEASLQAIDNRPLFYKYLKERNGLKIYNTSTIEDSLQVFATLRDSLNSIVKDTFYIKFTESSRKPDDFNVSAGTPIASYERKTIVGEIKFDKPLKRINLDSISLKKDSLIQYYVYSSSTFKQDTLENILHYTIPLPQPIIDSFKNKKQAKPGGQKVKKLKIGGEKYELNIPPLAFLSIENDSSQQINKVLKFIIPEQTGLIKGKISSDYNSYFIQLLNNTFEVVKEQHNGEAYYFDEVPPGEYLIRILVDNNENGSWDLGDIRLNIPPEKVILYKDEDGASKTSIRANWEVTIDLDF